MALEGPEELEICRQMQEEIKERLQESLFQWKFFFWPHDIYELVILGRPRPRYFRGPCSSDSQVWSRPAEACLCMINSLSPKLSDEHFKKEAENRTKLWNDKTIDFDLGIDIDEDFQ